MIILKSKVFRLNLTVFSVSFLPNITVFLSPKNEPSDKNSDSSNKENFL